MESKKQAFVIRLVVIMLVTSLVPLALAGCGAVTPTPTATPAATATAAPTATPSASEMVDEGMAHVEEGDFDGAVAAFEQAIELDSEYAAAYRNLGTARAELGQFQAAVDAYEQAIDLDPTYGEAYGDLVWPYVELGMADEAIAAGEEAVNLAPDYAQGRNNLAVAYHNQGRVDEAIAQWEEAIRLDPEHAGALENVARAYGQEARWPEAVEAYEAYLAIEPSDDGAYTNLGIAYAEVGRMEDAVGAWQAAIEANPSSPNPHKNLGLVYGQQGEVEKAIAEFQTYVELAPDAPDREAIEQNIATLQAQAAASWTEARNTAGGYALSYPQDWYRLDNDIQTALSPTQADYEAETLQAPLITCFAWPLDRAAKSFDLDEDAGPEDYLPVLAERLEAEIGPLQTGTVDGYAAALAPTSGMLRGTAFQGTLVMVRVEERLLIVDAVAPSGQWDAFSPLFRQMLESVSFFAPDQ